MTEHAQIIDPYAALRPRAGQWRLLQNFVGAGPSQIDFGVWQRMDGGKDPLRAIISIDLYDVLDKAAGHWLHISVSRRTKTPTWQEMETARAELGYVDRLFIQMHPPRAHWLNLHQHCLHMFSRIDGDAIPRVLWEHQGDGSSYGKAAPFGG